MTFSTRPPLEAAALLPDPPVARIMRQARVAEPDTRVAVLLELLRVAPGRVVPVRDGSGLIGLVSEASLARAFLQTSTPDERARVRELPARAVLEPLDWWLPPTMPASEAARILDRAGQSALPVLGDGGTYLGMLARVDLVEEMAAPHVPPVLGGMATPLGVYLTTGRVSGGVGTLALMSVGVAMATISLFVTLALVYCERRFPGMPLAAIPFGVRHLLPPPVLSGVEAAVTLLVMQVPLLLALRVSPVAGYHAAEHQVVHAVERGEPLLPEIVRTMPRVHPRCGTNLVATIFLATFVYNLLPAFPGGLNYLLAGVIAFGGGRPLGTWLQQHVTTKPASDAQIESGLRAARQALARHGALAAAPARPWERLWRMGFGQILGGVAALFLVIVLLAWLFPGLGGILKPALDELAAP